MVCNLHGLQLTWLVVYMACSLHGLRLIKVCTLFEAASTIAIRLQLGSANKLMFLTARYLIKPRSSFPLVGIVIIS